MDDADEREAFLNAIFDAPDDDLPRLVFADWLDERGESDWAELIRCQCQIDPAPQNLVRERELLGRIFRNEASDDSTVFERGFRAERRIVIAADRLGDAQGFRMFALRERPEWYSAPELKIAGGMILSGKPIQTLLTSPVTQRVTGLDLSGTIVNSPIADDRPHPEDSTALALLREYEYRPAVAVQAVEALVNAREARRLTHLDLRNNDLDNDAARAIVHSTNLIRLKSLHMFDGNQLRGRTWQQLLERFGPDVVQ